MTGDGIRRQLEASRDYAARHGLELDESLRDIGLSAFSGDNRRKGALKAFREKVESGEIPRGSILLVEHLDRLSREDTKVAFMQLMGLIESGVSVVTLCDERVYDENVDSTSLLISLIYMCKAHDESLTKSRRICAAWESKRRFIRERPMTSICPSWMRLDRASGRFTLLEDRAAIIRRIFTEAAEGMGRNLISRRLNEAAVPPFPGRRSGTPRQCR